MNIDDGQSKIEPKIELSRNAVYRRLDSIEGKTTDYKSMQSPDINIRANMHIPQIHDMHKKTRKTTTRFLEIVSKAVNRISHRWTPSRKATYGRLKAFSSLSSTIA